MALDTIEIRQGLLLRINYYRINRILCTGLYVKREIFP